MRRDAEQILACVLERRARHRARPLAVRALVVVAGMVLGIPGVVLTVVFPEAGIPLLVIALKLLALEYDWAARALSWVIVRWERIRAWFGRRSRAVHALMAVAAVGVGAGFVLLIA